MILKRPYLDQDRTAVWGWSGGGSMTLNLMFRYGHIYGTGVSVAPVGDQLLYDNIYQERYMGLPSENREDFVAGSPVTYASQLTGNLLLVHGTGDDNVHYQNAEVVINELIKHNRPFDMMSYPNRSHGIYEGKNTRRHLYQLLTRYITEHVDSKAHQPLVTCIRNVNVLTMQNKKILNGQDVLISDDRISDIKTHWWSAST